MGLGSYFDITIVGHYPARAGSGKREFTMEFPRVYSPNDDGSEALALIARELPSTFVVRSMRFNEPRPVWSKESPDVTKDKSPEPSPGPQLPSVQEVAKNLMPDLFEREKQWWERPGPKA